MPLGAGQVSDQNIAHKMGGNGFDEHAMGTQTLLTH